MTLLLQHHLGALYGLDLLEADYFRRAMKIFTQDFSHVIFVVVTDDMAWAEENLNIPGAQVCHVQKKPTLMNRVVEDFKTVVTIMDREYSDMILT